MPAQVTTRAQVNGYRFLIRRLEHALIRADSRMIHDPMRGQMRSLIVGLVVGVLIAGAAGVLAFFKPTPNLGDAQILLSKSSSALFVRIGDRVHPVLNLASARLIVGKSESPKQVDDKFLNQLALGPVVGIIGAPSSIQPGEDSGASSWTVCDSTQTPKMAEASGVAGVETTVLANNPVLDNDIRAASPADMILTRSGGTTFLVYQGVRAPIDVTNPVLMSALHLNGAKVRDFSPGLLDSIPLVDPIAPVSIPGAGEDAGYLGPGYRVGSILKTSDSRGQQLYVVLREGLQPISEATADIVRYSGGTSASVQDWRDVSPAMVSQVAVVHTLPVGHYPAASPQLVDVEPDPVVCMSWRRDSGAARASTRLLFGHRLPLPREAQPVRLATADGSGPGLDSAYLTPGTGEFVQATGVQPDSSSMGRLFYISDVGVRFGIKDQPSADALGVSGVKTDNGKKDTPKLAPWPVISLLPPGPELSAEAALIAHDGMPPDPHGTTVQQPKS
ncbi:type VII secretion protein EccB [Mycobacterium sp. SP-6446]|uniref:type VII secretion protein EccB n=1 Tax=Mycobacterium sp. SP-6446 TaxID=1834162 RepID=UPI00096FB5B0|nr:type VII secretion protein EccB [Mycobacterium sp. SP-6446]OMC08429.1 type VII secretion protein EccB [Mycobacterium sp. SP-6446]